MTIVRDPLTQQANRIDSKGRQLIRGFTENEGVFENRLGNAFNLNTGDVTLTSANESAIAYLKNNETADLVIVKTFVIIGTSTSGTGDLRVTFERNPDGGTIIDNATAGAIEANRNFGSNNPIDVDFYKGAEGYTLTGASGDMLYSILQAPARVGFDVGTIRLPKGSSIGVLVTPPASNTSMVVQVAFQVYEQTVAIPS